MSALRSVGSAMLVLAVSTSSLSGQEREAGAANDRARWAISPGIGVFTLLRLEAARESDSRASIGFALGVHPMGLPSVEALVRRRVGVAAASGAYRFVDVAALGFLPGTQFADGALPGVGLHLTMGRAWPLRSGSWMRLRFGVAVYHEISNDAAENPETDALPVLALDFGGRRR